MLLSIETMAEDELHSTTSSNKSNTNHLFLFTHINLSRYCFVQLKPDADIEQVKKDISQIEFGTGKISVENKITRHEVAEVRNKKITISWAFAHYVFSYCRSAEIRYSKCVVVLALTWKNWYSSDNDFWTIAVTDWLFSPKPFTTYLER